MAVDMIATAAAASALLKAGKVQEADDLLAAAMAQANAESTNPAPTPPAPTRNPNQVICDIVTAFAGLLGNPAVLEPLIAELVSVI